MPDLPDTPVTTPDGTLAAPDRVITREQPVLACVQCGADLPPPAPRAQRPSRFCRGSRCRSAWHAEQRRKRIAAIDAELDDIRLSLAHVALLVQELK